MSETRLADLTTLRLGGPAAHLVEATSEAELVGTSRRDLNQLMFRSQGGVTAIRPGTG